jgi:hypothetical protein
MTDCPNCAQERQRRLDAEEALKAARLQIVGHEIALRNEKAAHADTRQFLSTAKHLRARAEDEAKALKLIVQRLTQGQEQGSLGKTWGT